MLSASNLTEKDLVNSHPDLYNQMIAKAGLDVILKYNNIRIPGIKNQDLDIEKLER